MSESGIDGPARTVWMVLQTVLFGVSALGYLLGMAAVAAAVLDVGGSPIATALAVGLPFVISVAGASLAIAMSFSRESSGSLVPQPSFTDTERARLRAGGALPLFGLAIASLVVLVSLADATQSDFSPIFPFVDMITLVGFGNVLAVLLVGSTTSNGWERGVGIVYAVLAGVSVAVSVFGAGPLPGIGVVASAVILSLVLAAIPLTTAVAGYTRPAP